MNEVLTSTALENINCLEELAKDFNKGSCSEESSVKPIHFEMARGCTKSLLGECIMLTKNSEVVNRDSDKVLAFDPNSIKLIQEANRDFQNAVDNCSKPIMSKSSTIHSLNEEVIKCSSLRSKRRREDENDNMDID